MDTIKFPVILCTDAGTVFYKNDAAKKWICSPRLGSRLSRYCLTLSAEECNTRLQDICAHKRDTDTVDLHTGSCYSRALAAPFVYEGQNCVILLFCPLLQISRDHSDYHALETLIRRHGEEVLNFLRTREASPDEKHLQQASAHRRIHGAHERLIDYFKKLISVNGDCFLPEDIVDCLNRLRCMTHGLFSELGYRVWFDFDALGFVPNDKTPFLTLAVPFLSMAIAALEISPSKSGCVRLRMDGMDVCLEIEVPTDLHFERACRLTPEMIVAYYPELESQFSEAGVLSDSYGWKLSVRYDTFRDPALIFTMSHTLSDTISAIGILHEEPSLAVRIRNEEFFELFCAVAAMLLPEREPLTRSRMTEQTPESHG